ncbi:hypothetical protein E4U57_004631, partial [Claviceps arundinis]
MAHNHAVQRTAPIAIAPGPSRRRPTPQRRENGRKFEIGPNGAQTIASTEAPSLSASIEPCQSCRFSAKKCILMHDEDICAACQASGSDCSFIECTFVSPHSRKRKLNGKPHCEESSSKR